MGACPRFALTYGKKVEGAEAETPTRGAVGYLVSVVSHKSFYRLRKFIICGGLRANLVCSQTRLIPFFLVATNPNRHKTASSCFA
jgi:hypothetical protein